MKIQEVLVAVAIMMVILFVAACEPEEKNAEPAPPKTAYVYNIEHDGYTFIIFEQKNHSSFAMIHPDCSKMNPKSILNIVVDQNGKETLDKIIQDDD